MEDPLKAEAMEIMLCIKNEVDKKNNENTSSTSLI